MLISGKDRILGYAPEDIEYRKVYDDLSDSESEHSKKEKLKKTEEPEKNHATKLYIDVRKNLNNFL